MQWSSPGMVDENFKVFDAETYQCFWERKRKPAVQFALFNINKTTQSVKYNRFVIQEN